MAESEFRNVPVYRGGVKVGQEYCHFRKITSDIQACIFDWAGTVCDAGVFAPVLTFQKLFEDEGVPITTEEVRAPMGVHKRVRSFIFNSNLLELAPLGKIKDSINWKVDQQTYYNSINRQDLIK